jgi:hypothetical protein
MRRQGFRPTAAIQLDALRAGLNRNLCPHTLRSGQERRNREQSKRKIEIPSSLNLQELSFRFIPSKRFIS